MIQVGISKNWLDFGKTAVYGEYGVANDWGADFTNAAGTTIGRNYSAAGFTSVNGVTATEMKVWGLGIAQDFGAASTGLFSFASTTLFAGYRHFDANIRCADLAAAATCSGGVAAGAAAGIFRYHKLATEGLGVTVIGTRVLF